MDRSDVGEFPTDIGRKPDRHDVGQVLEYICTPTKSRCRDPPKARHRLAGSLPVLWRTPRVSLFPCDVHGSRVRGPLEAAYLAVLDGGTRYSRRLRLCADCLSTILSDEDDAWKQVTDDADLRPSLVCSACGEGGDAPSAFSAIFATVYRRGADRVDYFAQECHDCAKATVLRYELAP